MRISAIESNLRSSLTVQYGVLSVETEVHSVFTHIVTCTISCYGIVLYTCANFDYSSGRGADLHLQTACSMRHVQYYKVCKEVDSFIEN